MEEIVEDFATISDESDFYGDETVLRRCERQADRPLKRGYQPPIPREAYKKVKIDDPVKQPLDVKPTCQPPGNDDLFDFLKSHPQLDALAKAHKTDFQASKLDVEHLVCCKPRPDHINVPRPSERRDACCESETIDDFLRRAPVEHPETAIVGPWLWVHAPSLPYQQAQAAKKPKNMAAFEAGGEAWELLAACDTQRATIETQNTGKEASTTTRKMAPYRDQLEMDLLNLALKSSITSGKWMFFPSRHDLPYYWRVVATATSKGKLGPTSKVGTYDASESSTLICVYTYNFNDTDDVRRVLNELVHLGLVSQDGKPIHYKCDAYTCLGITSGNRWRLKASLYSSKQILQTEAKALEDGPVARLKKRNRDMDDVSVLFDENDIP